MEILYIRVQNLSQYSPEIRLQAKLKYNKDYKYKQTIKFLLFYIIFSLILTIFA